VADIVFYEKPGCVNGEKQKAILRAAGHRIICIDILTFPWSREKLLGFVADKEPVEMMNHTAPAIKNGEIIGPANYIRFTDSLVDSLKDIQIGDSSTVKSIGSFVIPAIKINSLYISQPSIVMIQ
jgi:hypothetical protein